MAPEKNPLKIYKQLPKTNCRECYLPGCLAFAAAVVSGDKQLSDCPHLPTELVRQLTGSGVDQEPYQVMLAKELDGLRRKVADLDLAALAGPLGGRMDGKRLVIPCLGKDYYIEPGGTVTSICHTHCGLTIPLLNYITHGPGSKPAGNWVSFRELKGAAPMNALFEQRGEKRLKNLADTHLDLFNDLVTIFSGSSGGGNRYHSDISVVLRPLPNLPVLICYWRPEEDLGSKLNIFFDAVADQWVPIQFVFELAVGMVMMFEKIAAGHR